MFEKIADNLMKGAIALSFLLFSSYEGNNASFNTPELEVLDSGISCRTELVGAFENDFDDVFKSGEEISLDFDIDIYADGEIYKTMVHNHTVEYKPMEKTYVMKNNAGFPDSYFTELNEMIKAFSQFDRLLLLPDCDKCTIRIIAKLNKLFFASQQKEFDLNLLWKNKSPELKININPVDYK